MLDRKECEGRSLVWPEYGSSMKIGAFVPEPNYVAGLMAVIGAVFLGARTQQLVRAEVGAPGSDSIAASSLRNPHF